MSCAPPLPGTVLRHLLAPRDAASYQDAQRYTNGNPHIVVADDRWCTSCSNAFCVTEEKSSAPPHPTTRNDSYFSAYVLPLQLNTAQHSWISVNYGVLGRHWRLGLPICPERVVVGVSSSARCQRQSYSKCAISGAGAICTPMLLRYEIQRRPPPAP